MNATQIARRIAILEADYDAQMAELEASMTSDEWARWEAANEPPAELNDAQVDALWDSLADAEERHDPYFQSEDYR